jgi:hypothetical protein
MNKKEEIFKNNIPSFPEKSLILKAMEEYGKYCAEEAFDDGFIESYRPKFSEWWKEFQRKEEQK